VQNLLDNLKLLLEAEISLHEGLRDDLALEAEQDGKLNSQDFLQLQQRKYTRVHQIETLEAQRQEQVKALADAWSRPAGELTLQEISRQAGDSAGDDLRSYRESLLQLTEEIRNLAKRTGANAQARLKAIDATLAVIGEAVRLHPTYSPGGKIKQRPPTFKQTSA